MSFADDRSDEPEFGDREQALFRRFRDDFLFYAPRALRIRPKAGSIVPFTLNSAQRKVHEEIEKQRAETGLVRVVVLKGRQQGISTYAQGRFFWRITHGAGLRAFILTHLDATTDNLYGMVSRFYEYCPSDLKPTLGAANAKELSFKKLGSGYKIATAGAKGVGVGDTLQLFHGSECSKWPNAESHISGALQAVPYERGTEVILESTSDGPTGVFYDLCNAAKMGESDYRLIFVPWFLQTEYQRPVSDGFELTGEEHACAQEFGLTLPQMAWRRAKIRELRSLQEFRRQYPATYEEAWKVDAIGALWTRAMLDACRVAQLPEMRRVVVAIDPSGGIGKRNDECGIVVAGLGIDNRGYVLEDASGKYTPAEWGRKAVALYERYQADRIIAERNFGGDMVEATIRAVSPRVPYKDVSASRGKQQRAEPVAALYSEGAVSHYGMFAALEDELTTWVPSSNGRSPNRLDACLAAGTLVNTARGEVPIENVVVGDEVLTRRGYRRVLGARMTSAAAEVRLVQTDQGQFRATGDHLVLTEDSGWVSVDALTWEHTLLACTQIKRQRPSSLTGCNFADSRKPSSDQTASITARTGMGVASQAAVNCTLRYGNRQTALMLCPQDASSIIETKTHSTTPQIISSVSHERSTASCTRAKCARLSKPSIWPTFVRWHRSGTLRRKALNGIDYTGEILGRAENLALSCVRHVVRFLKREMPNFALASVPQTALGASQMPGIATTNRFLAQPAVRSFGRTNTNSSPQLAPARVLGVYAVAERAPVYDLMVDGEHEFFANGHLVHNCVWALTELMLQETRRYDTTMTWATGGGTSMTPMYPGMFGII